MTHKKHSLRWRQFLHSFTFFPLTVLCAIKKKTGQGPPIGSAYLPLKASLNFMFTSGFPSPAVFLPLVSAHKKGTEVVKEVEQTTARYTHIYMKIRRFYCTYPLALTKLKWKIINVMMAAFIKITFQIFYQNLFISNKHTYKIPIYKIHFLLNYLSVKCGIKWTTFFFFKPCSALV